MSDKAYPHPDDYAALERLLTTTPQEDAEVEDFVTDELVKAIVGVFDHNGRYHKPDDIEAVQFVATLLGKLETALPDHFGHDIVMEAAKQCVEDAAMIKRIVSNVMGTGGGSDKPDSGEPNTGDATITNV